MRTLVSVGADTIPVLERVVVKVGPKHCLPMGQQPSRMQTLPEGQ
jgi:hypothetical protein